MFKKSFMVLLTVLYASVLINGCNFNDDTETVAVSNGLRFVIEGTLPAIFDGAVSAPTRAADFGTSGKYSIGLYQLNGSVEGGEIEGSLASTDSGKYSVSVPFASNDISAVLVVHDKATGCAIHKTLIGMLPKSAESGGRTIKLKNVSFDPETTARTLLTIEKNLIPAASMITGQTVEIAFASVPAFAAMNKVASAANITAIAAAVKHVAGVICSSRVSDDLKKHILPSANGATEMLSAFLRIVKSADTNVKSIVAEGTALSVNGTLIDKNTADVSGKLIEGIKTLADPGSKVATPELTPTAGSFKMPVEVSIFCATPSAQIRYTLDGSVPDASSPLFTSSVILEKTVTVNACAFKDGMETSEVASARYVINLSIVTVGAPVPYEYKDNGADITIIKYTGPGGAVTIPSTIKGKPVKTISMEAFYKCKSLTSVIIPASVTSIGSRAFDTCGALASVTIPEGVASIGEGAFYCCGSLTSVIIPASVKSIGNYAFNGCSALTSVTISEGVTKIGGSGFRFCTNLTSITIPEGVTSIDGSTFQGCSNLTSVTIPSTVNSISDNAFDGCTSLFSASFEGYPPSSFGANVFSGCAINFNIFYHQDKTGWTNPWNTYTTVGAADFKFTDSGSDITITGYNGAGGVATIPSVINGRPVNTISNSAFSKCASLTSVIIPASVTSIGDSAFSNCTRLAFACFYGNALSSFGKNVFSGCAQNFKIYYFSGKTGWTNPWNTYNTLLADADYKFTDNGPYITITGYAGPGGAVEIPSIITGKPVKTIGDSAFFGRNALTSVTIPSGVTSIGVSAFLSCNNLTSVTMPASVKSIGTDAFGKCGALTSVTIPSAVTEIGNLVFSGCTNLVSAYFEGNAPLTFGNSVFSNCNTAFKIYYTAGKTGWTNPWNSYTTVNIADFKFTDSGSGITITGYNGAGGAATIPPFINGKPVKTIGNSAFSNCGSLTSVLIPASVTSIGDNAFSNCTLLASACFYGNALSSFGKNVFSGCARNFMIYYFSGKTGWTNPWNTYATQLASADYKFTDNGSDITIMGYTGPGGAVEIPSTIIGKPVKMINTSAFYNCSTLTSVTIPSAVTSIGDSAFANCGSLTSVRMSSGVTSIGEWAFFNCKALTSITISSGVTSIAYKTFFCCGSLKSVDIPPGVTSIGNYAFAECASLETVKIPPAVKSIGVYAFFNCLSLETVTISSGVTFIDGNGFSGCNNLVSAYFHGDAPQLDVFVFFNSKESFKIYYKAGKKGWTTPTWYGYQTSEF